MYNVFLLLIRVLLILRFCPVQSNLCLSRDQSALKRPTNQITLDKIAYLREKHSLVEQFYLNCVHIHSQSFYRRRETYKSYGARSLVQRDM